MAMDVYELEIIGETAGEYNECIPAFQGAAANSTTPLTDAAALIAAFVATWQVNWLACLAQDYSLAGYKCRRVNNTGGPNATTVSPPATTGGVVGTSCPQQTAQLFTGSYFNAGGAPARWRVGRINLPSVPESGYTAPAYTDAQIILQNVLLAQMNATLGSSPAGPFTMGVWSRKQTKFFSAMWDVSLLVGTIKKRLHPAL